jgi:CTP:molybdopterin cytidylyltransferase MocA
MERIKVEEVEIAFTSEGIRGRKVRKTYFFPYRRYVEAPFFTLLVLAGREKEESALMGIVEKYTLPVIREIIAVVGKEIDWRKFQKWSHLKVVYSAKPEDVILTSLKDGLRVLSPRSQAVILCLANRPILESDKLEKLIKASLKEERDIVVPLIGGEPSHPIIIPRRTALEMLKTRKEMGIPYFGKRWRKEVPCD